MATIGLGLYAAQGQSGYLAPAIGAGVYTVVTINNAFDKKLHEMMGFLDSPVSYHPQLELSMLSENEQLDTTKAPFLNII